MKTYVIVVLQGTGLVKTRRQSAARKRASEDVCNSCAARDRASEDVCESCAARKRTSCQAFLFTAVSLAVRSLNRSVTVTCTLCGFFDDGSQ